ncbi:MAG: TatD family nuclease-associated radical SAM protein [Thermoleophilia bacterium]
MHAPPVSRPPRPGTGTLYFPAIMKDADMGSQARSESIPGPNYVYWGGRNLYVNLTSRCSSACVFCLREWTWNVYGYDLRLAPAQEPTAEDVITALEYAFLDGMPDEVVFTGLGEPTLRLDEILALLDWLRTRRLRTRLDTNGQAGLLHPGRDVAGELAAAGLGAASVSLNASDPVTYDRVCRPLFAHAFRAVTRFIRAAVQAGIEVTATVVAVPQVDVEAARALAAELGAAFRVRPLITVDAGASVRGGSDR